MQEAVQNYVSETQRDSVVVTRIIDAPDFTVSVAKVVKNHVEKFSLDKSNMEKWSNKLAEAVDDKKMKRMDGIPKI